MKFKGHQSFYIRQGWLTKGLRQVDKEAKFFTSKDIDPMMELGIGSNMVSAVKYWLCCVGLTKEEKNKGQFLTIFGNLVKENDSHQQKIGTLLWMHYQIAKNLENATSWNIFFNSNVFEFDKERFLEEINDFIKKNNEKEIAEKSILDDFDCISHTYCKKDFENASEIDFEDIACPLSELELLKKTKFGLRKNPFNIEKLPDYLALAMIFDSNEKIIKTFLDENKNPEIKISELENGTNSIGKILNLSISDVGNLLDRLKMNGFVEVVRTAGLEIVRFTKKINDFSAEECLRKYYGSN